MSEPRICFDTDVYAKTLNGLGKIGFDVSELKKDVGQNKFRLSGSYYCLEGVDGIIDINKEAPQCISGNRLDDGYKTCSMPKNAGQWWTDQSGKSHPVLAFDSLPKGVRVAVSGNEFGDEDEMEIITPKVPNRKRYAEFCPDNNWMCRSFVDQCLVQQTFFSPKEKLFTIKTSSQDVSALNLDECLKAAAALGRSRRPAKITKLLKQLRQQKEHELLYLALGSLYSLYLNNCAKEVETKKATFGKLLKDVRTAGHEFEAVERSRTAHGSKDSGSKKEIVSAESIGTQMQTRTDAAVEGDIKVVTAQNNENEADVGDNDNAPKPILDTTENKKSLVRGVGEGSVKMISSDLAVGDPGMTLNSYVGVTSTELFGEHGIFTMSFGALLALGLADGHGREDLLLMVIQKNADFFVLNNLSLGLGYGDEWGYVLA